MVTEKSALTFGGLLRQLRSEARLTQEELAEAASLSPRKSGGVSSVAFSPDGKTLATGSGEETVRLWDVATRQPIGGLFTGHGGSVTSVAFSPGGKILASGSYDLTVRLWNVAAPNQNVTKVTDLVRYLCALAGRSLTRAEWAAYVPHLAYQSVCP